MLKLFAEYSLIRSVTSSDSKGTTAFKKLLSANKGLENVNPAAVANLSKKVLTNKKGAHKAKGYVLVFTFTKVLTLSLNVLPTPQAKPKASAPKFNLASIASSYQRPSGFIAGNEKKVSPSEPYSSGHKSDHSRGSSLAVTKSASSVSSASNL